MAELQKVISVAERRKSSTLNLLAALARSYGLHGEIVERTADFETAFERAFNAKTAALIEVRIDPEAITPRQTLSAIRAEALRSKQA